MSENLVTSGALQRMVILACWAALLGAGYVALICVP